MAELNLCKTAKFPDSWRLLRLGLAAVSAAFVKFTLLTGMRRGELFKLTWDDIDFERGMVTLREPKGGKTLTIPVSSMALEVLRGT